MIGEAYKPIKDAAPDGGASALWPSRAGPKVTDVGPGDAVSGFVAPGGGALKVSIVDPAATNEATRVSKPSADAMLDAAARHMRDRASTYDKPEGGRSMAATVKAFNAITGLDLSESDGWLLMALLKMVRSEQRPKPHKDSVEDLVAYSALYGEARMGGQ